MHQHTASEQQTNTFTDTELYDECTISFDVCLHEVVEKASSLTNHLKKTAAEVMILLVDSEVICCVVDSLCEELRSEPPENLYLPHSERTC